MFTSVAFMNPLLENATNPICHILPVHFPFVTRMSIKVPTTIGELRKLFTEYPNVVDSEANKLKVNDLVVAWLGETVKGYIPAQIVKIDECNKEYHVVYFYRVERCCNGTVKMDRVWRPNQVKSFNREQGLFYSRHNVDELLSVFDSRVRELPAAIKLIEEALQRSKSTTLVLSTENIESFTGTFIKNKWNGQISVKNVDDFVFGRGTYCGKVVDNVRSDTEGEFVTEEGTLNPVMSYNGCWSENFATGPAAKLKYRNGSSYDGAVVKGVACGLGVMNLSKGTVKTMFGNWTDMKHNGPESIVATAQHGFAAFIKAEFTDNRIYQGQFGGLYGDKQGAIGAIQYENGDFTFGEMKQGCLDGMGIFRNADGHVSIGCFRQNKLNGKGLTLNEKDTLSNQFAFYSDQWNASSNSVDSTPGLLYLFGSDCAPVDYLFEQIDSLEEKLDKIKIEDACYKWLLQTNQVFLEEDKIFSIEKPRKDYKQVEKKQVDSNVSDIVVDATQPVGPTSILAAAQPSILPAAPANDSTKPSVPAAQPVQPVQSTAPESSVPAAQPAAQHA